MDEYFMQLALEEACKAYEQQEVPVGAVAVRGGEVIARDYNQVESLQDASAHAELLCLRKASQLLGGWRLSGVTLYTTLEPCALCAGAMYNFRIDRLVWGAPDIRQGAAGSWVNLFSCRHPIHPFLEVKGGVLGEVSAGLLRDFFRAKRGEKRS